MHVISDPRPFAFIRGRLLLLQFSFLLPELFASYPQEIFMAEFKSDPQHPETGRTTQPQGGDNYTFKCSDVGFKACNWATRGSSPEEVLRSAEQHGREAHNLTSIDDKTRDMVRSNIHRAA
jgi:predicted small metal-binding protein